MTHRSNPTNELKLCVSPFEFVRENQNFITIALHGVVSFYIFGKHVSTVMRVCHDIIV